ncbi:unnamed protein product, partial [Vitis vinifera]
MAEQPRRFTVGYALAPKKVSSFIQPSLVDHAKQRGIDLVRIDLDKPLIEQGPFDCIIHKMNDEDWKNQLEEFSTKNPNVVIIDPPDAIEQLHSRISMLEVVKELKIPEGTENGRVCEPWRGYLQGVCSWGPCDLCEAQVVARCFEAEMPPLNFVNEIAIGLRKAMGLNLFNFDVIRDAKLGNRYLVIDINYFPGYAKMPSYETVLTDFFWDIVHRKSLGMKDFEQSGSDCRKSDKEA